MRRSKWMVDLSWVPKSGFYGGSELAPAGRYNGFAEKPVLAASYLRPRWFSCTPHLIRIPGAEKFEKM